MHTYLLTFFEKLVRIELKQKQINHAQTESEYWTDTIINIQKEKNKFLEDLSRTIFGVSEAKEIEWRVQIYQQKIIVLLDIVTEIIGTHDLPNVPRFDPEPSFDNVQKTLYSSLTEMLSFIETDFAKYLDVNNKVPTSYQVAARQKIELRLKALNKAYNKTDISKQLYTIILLPFQDFLSNAPDGFYTYQRMSYMNMLLQQLTNLVSKKADTLHINDMVQDKLRELNFNHSRYFNYYVDNIREELEPLSQKEQLERLVWMLKKVDQIQHKPGIIYSRSRESLQQQLRNWINAEINFLKEVFSLPGGGHPSGDSGRWKDFKVITQFSVPQLGHVIKLLSDTGMFVNENKKEMLDFFSEFFTSAKQENISAGSLRKHFYASDTSAVQGVRDKLFTLLSQSKKSMAIGLTLLLSV